MSWYAYCVVQKSSNPILLSSGTERRNLPEERLDWSRVANLLRFSRSSFDSGEEAWEAKKEVSSREEIAQLSGEHQTP